MFPEQPLSELAFLNELIEEHATVAGDIAEVGLNTWAIHGVIAMDGEVMMAAFASYEQARIVLDQLSAEGH
jgi:hypothetical protein